MKSFKKSFIILSVIDSLALLFLCILLMLQFYAFNSNFYSNEFEKLNISEYMKIDKEDLESGVDTLINYMKGNSDDIHILMNIDNEKQPLFNEMEEIHMVDVAKIFTTVKTLTYILFSIVVLILLLLVFLKRQQNIAIIKLFTRSFVISSFSILLLLGILLFIVSLDFSKVWNLFHEMLFTNDYWLLDPLTDNMINMFPNIFFIDMIKSIVVSSFSIFIFINLSTTVIYKSLVKNKHTVR